jgi:hypothetical protein
MGAPTLGNAAVAKAHAVRDVRLEDFGKVVLEEILLQAADLVSADPTLSGAVDVTMTFTVRPDHERQGMQISLPGMVEETLATLLPMHFKKADPSR